MSRPPRWTPEQLEAAMQAYQDGASIKDVEATGVPWPTVHRYRRLRGIPARPTGRVATPGYRSSMICPVSGYVKTYARDHPYRGNRNPTTLEHVRVMELHIGRQLERHEVVHHIDHDRTNNQLSNLQLMTRAEHARAHRLGTI